MANPRPTKIIKQLLDLDPNSPGGLTSDSISFSGGVSISETINELKDIVTNQISEDYVVGIPKNNYTGSLTTFVLESEFIPLPNTVYVTYQGVLMFRGSDNDYTLSDNGVNLIINFNYELAPGSPVSIRTSLKLT